MVDIMRKHLIKKIHEYEAFMADKNLHAEDFNKWREEALKMLAVSEHLLGFAECRIKELKGETEEDRLARLKKEMKNEVKAQRVEN